MPNLGEGVVQQQNIAPFLASAVILGLLGLPTAVWLDLRGLSERLLKGQASEIGRIIDEMRGFYARDVDPCRVFANDLRSLGKVDKKPV